MAIKTVKFPVSIFSVIVFFIICLGFVYKLKVLSYPNQYVFDEDFFAFTAKLMSQRDVQVYEWWHPPFVEEQNQYTYRAPAIEWLHPPLTKLIQAASIKTFGDTPFAWRLPSAMAGAILGLIVMFFVFTFTQNKVVSLTALGLANFESLLFVQSRLASPDIFLALFVTITVWLYWLWQTKRQPKFLLFTGITFGLAIASKWSGFFIFPSLVLFSYFYKNPKTAKLGWQQKLNQVFLTNFAVLSLGLAIYVLSYNQAVLLGKTAQDIFNLHFNIWSYQTKVTFAHPYQSRPQEWLVGQKPIWYYYSATDKKEEKIVAHPTVWLLLLGELSLILSAAKLCRNQKNQRKNTNDFNQNLLLVLVVFSLWLPWLFIPRTLFIYQLTPIMPFIIISLSIILSKLIYRLVFVKTSTLKILKFCLCMKTSLKN